MDYELPEGYSYSYEMDGETVNIHVRTPDIPTITGGKFIGSILRSVHIKKVDDLAEALTELAQAAHQRENSLGRSRTLKAGLTRWAAENGVEIKAE